MHLVQQLMRPIWHELLGILHERTQASRCLFERSHRSQIPISSGIVLSLSLRLFFCVK
jgi:hypothetical protein